jgi:chromosomal replication initiator protein
VDVLVVDDIQFFAGKESTQEQFFHTFNALYHLGKQIVLSSDRSPRDIKGLEERLLSRFSMGLVTDIQVPDYENRMAIIYKKLDSENSSLPHEVVAYIADKINTNIRDLEGALIRLLAYAYLKKVKVDIEMAKGVLEETFHSRRKQVNIDAVKRVVSKEFDVPVEIMVAKKKTAKVALARQVAMYLSRTLTDTPLKGIGEEFGGRDHSTVIHACDTVGKRISNDPVFRERVDRLSSTIMY